MEIQQKPREKQNTSTSCCSCTASPERPTRAKRAKISREEAPVIRTTNFLSFPESLLEHILCTCGSAAPALAQSCKLMSQLWKLNTRCQALWLLHNSSSIMIAHGRSYKLAPLAAIAIAAASPDTYLARKLQWLTWATRPSMTDACYGGCRGQHQNGSSCCFPLDLLWRFRQDDLLKAAKSGALDNAAFLIRLGTDVQANGNAALCAAAAAGHLEMIDLLIKHGADMNQGLGKGEGAFLQACRASNIPVIDHLSQHRSLARPLGRKEAAERIAISSHNLHLFQHLFSKTAQQQGSAEATFYTQAQATMQYIIVHHRHPMPFLQVCLDNGASHACAVRCLLNAGKWAAADTFVRSLPPGIHSQECWTALCEGYMAKTGSGDRWIPTGELDPVWEAAIECAQRSCHAMPGCLVQWRRIYTFSFSVQGSDSALNTAEEAAGYFAGYAEMVALVKVYRRAGRVEDALRCKVKARIIQALPRSAAPFGRQD